MSPPFLPDTFSKPCYCEYSWAPVLLRGDVYLWRASGVRLLLLLLQVWLGKAKRPSLWSALGLYVGFLVVMAFSPILHVRFVRFL